MNREWIIGIVCVVIGYILGIIKPFLSDMLTDWRRKKEEDKQLFNCFRKIKEKMPDLIDEMKSDFSDPKWQNVRTLIVFDKEERNYSGKGKIYKYTLDKYEDIFDCCTILENNGYLEYLDGDKQFSAKYQITEEFFELVLNC